MKGSAQILQSYKAAEFKLIDSAEPAGWSPFAGWLRSHKQKGHVSVTGMIKCVRQTSKCWLSQQGLKGGQRCLCLLHQLSQHGQLRYDWTAHHEKLGVWAVSKGWSTGSCAVCVEQQRWDGIEVLSSWQWWQPAANLLKQHGLVSWIAS